VNRESSAGVNVVVAAAIERDGCFLAARRTRPERDAGYWEFPGGKVEDGESEADALVREIREELGVVIEVKQRVPGEWPLRDGWILRLYTAGLIKGEPQPLEQHDELRWLMPGDFGSVTWLPSDVDAVSRLASATT
jgi:8-oxo-dGTP diphosphatase